MYTANSCIRFVFNEKIIVSFIRCSSKFVFTIFCIQDVSKKFLLFFYQRLTFHKHELLIYNKVIFLMHGQPMPTQKLMKIQTKALRIFNHKM